MTFKEKKNNAALFLVAQIAAACFCWWLLKFSANPPRWSVTPKQQHAHSNRNISDIHFYGLMLLKLKTSALRNADFLDVNVLSTPPVNSATRGNRV